MTPQQFKDAIFELLKDRKLEHLMIGDDLEVSRYEVIAKVLYRIPDDVIEDAMFSLWQQAIDEGVI